jgi:predicted ATPase
MLIVLDTCEQAIDAAAEIAEALLSASAGVRVIATSREPLGAYGEWVYRVRPLTVPSAEETSLTGSDAVSLFIARARATDVDFPADQPAAAAIAAICRGLDGVPLAIELAAIRATTLGLYTLCDRIADHLQLLTCGRRTAAPRHRTLRATLDWSYGLLTPAERAVLHCVAVLPGEFDLDEARATAAAGNLTPAQATVALANLVTKSLVATEMVGGTTCYRLLGTTRAYALEKLAEPSVSRDAPRHRGAHPFDSHTPIGNPVLRPVPVRCAA